MHGRPLALAVVLVASLLAGCTAPTVDPGERDRTLTDDRIGYVDGYAWNDAVAADGSDGLTKGELDAVVPRAMARLERERGLNFERTVPVEIITREQYRQQSGQFVGSYGQFEREAWRAAFLVGDDTNVSAEFQELYGSSVAGFYTSRGGGRIVIVTEDPDAVRISRATLVHELAHALQDQHGGIGRQTATRDERLAWNGLVEGEAQYLMDRYERRCSGEWSCVEIAGGDGARSADSASLNMGLFLTLYHPYSDGPAFVEALRDRGGWDAVASAHENPPTSTAQIIHPERYPDDRPRNVSVPDRSGDDWERLTADGEARTDRLGEATLFAAFWHHGVIDRQYPFGANGEYDRYDYSHPLTDGWAGDRLYVYSDGDRTAHVFRSAWTNASEAAEFRGGYERLLERNNATVVSDGVYRVPDGEPFAGAYRVTRRGDTVTVVRAPTVDALDAVHAPRAPAGDGAATHRSGPRSRRASA